jgi:hypothetical protein
MDRHALKHRRGVIPVQRDKLRIGVWDEDGGVFTQENPRWSASQVEETESKLFY